MKEYYYVSEGIVKAFPDLEKSKSFEWSFGKLCYVVVIPDFSIIEEYVKSCKDDEVLFAYQCVDSLVDLTYDAVDYDEHDNEIEILTTLNIDTCKEWGLITAIEQELSISKEQNIAYVIYKLAEQENVSPIDLINLI